MHARRSHSRLLIIGLAPPHSLVAPVSALASVVIAAFNAKPLLFRLCFIMEALAGLGVAANIFQFLEYGLKIIGEAKRLKDNRGLPDPALELHTLQLRVIVQGLERDKSARPLTEEHQCLLELSCECLAQTDELLGLLESLKAKQPGSVINRLRAAVKNRNRTKEKTNLEAKLERCKSQLQLQLSKLAR